MFKAICLAVVGLLVSGAAFADPFMVRGVKVDVTSASAVQARSQAQSQARVAAAQRLIERLTLPEDRKAAGGIAIDSATALRLYAAIDVEDEKSSATRYIGSLAVKFDPKAVRSFLDGKKVAYVESQAAKAVIEPVALQGVDIGQWAAAWAGRANPDSLTPFEVSLDAWEVKPIWSQVAGQASALGASRVILAQAYIQQGSFYVTLSEMRAGEAETTLLVTGPHRDLPSAAAAAAAELENAWKQQSIVRTTGLTEVALIARFATHGDWVRIRKGIESSRIVSGLQIESVSARGADLRFSFAGRPDQLASDLRSRGVSLGSVSGGWVVEVVGAQ